jgi:leader peptidase (prepilin peptidase) / N-methyltransferase
MPLAAAIPLGGALGLLVGSFLNVVAHRLPRGESLVKPRSRCPGCRAQIAAYDNVPVLSWLVLRGRCRSCGTPIAVRYPALEALTGLVFAAIVAVHGFDERLALYLPFAAMLVAVAAIDLEHRIIPNRILAPLALWGIAGWVLVDADFLPEALAAGAGAFAFLLLAAVAYPAGMGMGDVKLAGVMGLYLGLSVVAGLLVAFLAGSVVGIAMIAREGAAARKKGLPFGPFLALGGIVAVLVGDDLISLYADRFL